MPNPNITHPIELYASRTSQVYLLLFRLEHEDITTVRLVMNDEDITSNGELYTAASLKMLLPSDQPEELPQPTVTIYDPLQTLTQALLEMPSGDSPRATVVVSVIRAATPDVSQSGDMQFQLLSARGSENGEVQLTIGFEDVVAEGLGGLITPKYFHSMFLLLLAMGGVILSAAGLQ